MVNSRMEADRTGTVPWYRSREGRRFIVWRYMPLLAAGSLLWETAHLPLYTIWRESDAGTQIFAVLHCTVGDIMIGTAALLIAITLFGRRSWPQSATGRVLATATLIGLAYTMASEWVNTQIIMAWAYTETMPRVPPLGTGLSPLLQWLVIPPAAYGLAYAIETRRARARSSR